jgi:hypothetical protein
MGGSGGRGWYHGNREEGLRVFIGIWPGILQTIRPQYGEYDENIYGIYLMPFSASYLSWNPSSATRPAFSHIA